MNGFYRAAILCSLSLCLAITVHGAGVQQTGAYLGPAGAVYGGGRGGVGNLGVAGGVGPMGGIQGGIISGRRPVIGQGYAQGGRPGYAVGGYGPAGQAYGQRGQQGYGVGGVFGPAGQAYGQRGPQGYGVGGAYGPAGQAYGQRGPQGYVVGGAYGTAGQAYGQGGAIYGQGRPALGLSGTGVVGAISGGISGVRPGLQGQTYQQKVRG